MRMTGEPTADDSASSDGRGGDQRSPDADLYELDDVLDAVESLARPFEPFTVREVTEITGRSRSSTWEKLMELADEGVLLTKKTGARGRVFWTPLDTSYIDRGETHE